MASTCSILIGNSDDKLPQVRWAMYIKSTDAIVREHAAKVHFTGFSESSARWQNACWVFEMSPNDHQVLRKDLAYLAERYGQDTIALLLGETELVARES